MVIVISKKDCKFVETKLFLMAKAKTVHIGNKEFAKNIERYFELAGKKNQVLIAYKNKVYTLNTLTEIEKTSLDKKVIQAVEKGKKAIRKGEFNTYKNTKELWKSIH